jgi:hypothetical protein
LFAIAEHATENAEQVAARMQNMVAHWRGCLRVTGGNLNPDKCNWTLIGFYWDDDGQWHYRTNFASSVYIPDDTGEMQSIERLSPSQATTAVGVIQAADGNMTEQVLALKEAADDVGTRINKGYLPRNLVWQTLRTMVWSSIRFPLASTTISEEESEDITKILYSQLLPSGGANRHFPLAYRHAPFTFFGLSLPRVIDTQFIEQVKRVLVQGALPTTTGRFYNISFEQAQLEIGIDTPILQANYDDFGFLLTYCWVKVLWEQLWNHNVSLQNPDQVLPKLQREGDFFIMERIITCQGFSETNMIRINRCRLAFRAMTMADILTGDGVTVTKDARDLRRLSRPSSSWEWPNERPCSKDISQWRMGLTRITSTNWTLPFSLRLERWIQPPHLKWQWFYWRRERQLFHKTNGVWHHYVPFSERSSVAFKRVGVITSPPVPVEELQRATTRYDRGRVMFEGAADNAYPTVPVHETIHDFIAHWGESWPIEDSFFPEDPTLVSQAITSGTATMVSDGSYKPFLSTEIGAAAWILECSQSGAVMFGECSTSGLRHEVNAYRSELQGCHAGLLGLLAFSIYHKVEGGTVTFHFDNDAGLDKAAETNTNVTTRLKHSDLIRAIRCIAYKLRKEHLIAVHFLKVQGHRSDFVPFDQLTRPEQLNDIMDARAKARVDRIFAARAPSPPNTIKFEGWSCWIDEVKLTTEPTTQLLSRIHEAPMKAFLSRPDHLRMTAEGFDLVDWQAVHRSLDDFPEMFRVWASKHMSRFCAVGRMQKICGFWDHSRCPRCQEENETTTHVLLCSGSGANQEWSSRVTNLDLWLAEVDTHPSIHKCIISSLSSRTITTSFASNADQICFSAAADQDLIGWQNFVEGKIAKSWGDLQLTHLHEQFSKRTVDRWTAGLVSHMLEFTHGMWIHRNNVLHAVDEQGLPLRQAAELESTIHAEFSKDTEGLARRDYHFIRRGRDDVFSMSASDKQAWLRGIQLARESQDTAPPAHQQQQQLMLDFFQMADD